MLALDEVDLLVVLAKHLLHFALLADDVLYEVLFALLVIIGIQQLDAVVLVEEEILIDGLKLVFVLLQGDIQILHLQVWVLVLVKWLRDEFL